MNQTAAGALLAVRSVSKRYAETIALQDVSIDFGRSSIHTVLGENGSGKSTLVKLLSGITSWDSGEILLEGKRLEGGGPGNFLALGFATVFQEVLVAPDRDVIDNVLLGIDGMFRFHIPRGERAARVAAVMRRIARTRISLTELVGNLPLAQRQLIVIARALVREPRVLILDEATAALDHADRDAVFAEVEERARAGCLVLFISHRMHEVLRLSERISVLRSGRLVATLARGEATADDLLALMAPAKLVEPADG